MVAVIKEDEVLRDKLGVFRDRTAAGAYLAEALGEYRERDAMVLAIPSGGIPVGIVISSYLGIPFDMLIVRKINIPGNTEAGFGAIALGGDVILNEPMVASLGLSRDEIEELAEQVMEELKTRDQVFRQGRPWPDLKGRTVIIVDDGLASGFTMLAAIRMVRRQELAKIVVAVPTASIDTIRRVAQEVDEIVCPNVRTGPYFAVADAYRDWYDLTREEVVEMLRHNRLIA
jgi:putative phosphoribosyl transferase